MMLTEGRIVEAHRLIIVNSHVYLSRVYNRISCLGGYSFPRKE
ncbi:protein of unknown function [Vibrio tapetis subsp. tapetis]|uniref:Uncharacterized protein n=1 Tax=Vibrio tapetis subsp. tapetis TaxID=1671868 RepID=A0A2N8ZMP2_9VIBR|nr:protein of unknown function [Vibrio tapetis subsp. tapetis]